MSYKSTMNETIRVTIHELLHIMFFNYFEANFKGRLTKELAWDLSKILNVILLNLPEVNQFTNIEEKAFPNHKERCEHLKRIYSTCSSMKEFMEKAIVYLNGEGDQFHELGWVDKA